MDLRVLHPQSFSVHMAAYFYGHFTEDLRENSAHAHAVCTRPSFPLPLEGLGTRLKEGTTSGLRIFKSRRSHWMRCLTDLEYSNHCCDIHLIINKTEKK